MAKSKLTKSQVKYIAKLANLQLSPAELKKFTYQLAETLDYIEILNELKTQGVEETSQVTGLENVLREDKPGPSLSQEEVLSNANNQHNFYFRIGAIFNK